jgi:phospholipase/carboxylesterase
MCPRLMEEEPQELRPESFRMPGIWQRVPLGEESGSAKICAGHTWYPNSFLAPIERNEPWLSSALELVASIIEKLADEGVPHTKVAILGFSQGACLATEFVARNPIRYGGLVAFTGASSGLQGLFCRYSGDLGGTPCFLGSGDPDPHVPWERVKESASILSAQGRKLTLKRYPGMPHTISSDEITEAKNILSPLRA